jgi:hypothetical protein
MPNRKTSRTKRKVILLKHRLILQAAFCVEDLLMAMEKDGGRPWIAIVAEHMEALFPCHDFKEDKVVYAHDCKPCPDCGEPWCAKHKEHYADCPCQGPDSPSSKD